MFNFTEMGITFDVLYNRNDCAVLYVMNYWIALCLTLTIVVKVSSQCNKAMLCCNTCPESWMTWKWNVYHTTVPSLSSAFHYAGALKMQSTPYPWLPTLWCGVETKWWITDNTREKTLWDWGLPRQLVNLDHVYLANNEFYFDFEWIMTCTCPRQPC